MCRDGRSRLGLAGVLSAGSQLAMLFVSARGVARTGSSASSLALGRDDPASFSITHLTRLRRGERRSWLCGRAPRGVPCGDQPRSYRRATSAAGLLELSLGEKRLEATGGFEPPSEGFAGPCLTTWPRRLRAAYCSAGATPGQDRHALPSRPCSRVAARRLTSSAC